jgi:hypothetical protein
MTQSASASTNYCTSAICAPSSDGVIDMRRPLNGPVPATICTFATDWRLDSVVQIVGGLLKISWYYTFIPSFTCHLVG